MHHQESAAHRVFYDKNRADMNHVVGDVLNNLGDLFLCSKEHGAIIEVSDADGIIWVPSRSGWAEKERLWINDSPLEPWTYRLLKFYLPSTLKIGMI